MNMKLSFSVLFQVVEEHNFYEMFSFSLTYSSESRVKIR